MDFQHLDNMFGKPEEKENEVLAETKETINEVERIRQFFNSSAGKLFLSWFEEVKNGLTESLETCSAEDLVRLQANIGAVKLLTKILNDKFEELDDLKEYIKKFNHVKH